jgi:rhodanese-related sulfurtransferase
MSPRLFRRQQSDPPGEVTPRRASSLLEQGAVLLDVREPDEWNEGHAPHAQHVPLRQLPTHLTHLPRDAHIVAVCRSGNRSATAAAFLKAAGFDAVNLVGGMRAWQRAGLPVVRPGGGLGRVA